MSKFMDKIEQLTKRIQRATQLIRYAQDIYDELYEAMSELRYAAQTMNASNKDALREASDIERLLRRIDGKEDDHE